MVASFRPYRGKVSLVGLAIVITSVLGVVNPLLIKPVFETLFPQPARADPTCTTLEMLVGLMIVIPIVSGVIGVGQTYMANVVGQRVMQDFRNALYSHLQHMPLRFFTATRTGEIQSRLANDVGGVQWVVTDTASGILSNVVIIISTLVAMCILSWQLTVLSLFLTPIFLWLQRKGARQAVVAGKTQESLADICSIAEETLSVSGILLSKAFGRQTYEIGRFRDENSEARGPADPPADDRAFVLRRGRHVLLDHAGAGLPGGRDRPDEQPRRPRSPPGRSSHSRPCRAGCSSRSGRCSR